MGKRSLTLILLAALLTAKAIAQEIVIEPTNGHAPAPNHASRPAAAVGSASAGTKRLAPKAPVKSADREHGATKAAAKKNPPKQMATKPEAAPAAAEPAASVAPAVANIEAAAPMKAVERRPEWAMADTRDARSLQSEIAGALAHDPRLVGSAIQVSVDDGAVILEGHATGGREHLQAERLAKSYAWNRQVVDHITVSHVVVDRNEAQRAMAAKK